MGSADSENKAAVVLYSSKRSNFKWRKHELLLTIPCPSGVGDPLLGTTKKEILEWLQLAFGRDVLKVIASLELHESGKTHIHIYVKFAKCTEKKGTLLFKGCVVNNANKKKGRTSSGHCVKYVTKHGYLFEEGIGDPETYVALLLAGKPSKGALLVQAICDGDTDATITLNHPEACFMLGSKIAPFRLRHEVANYVSPPNMGLRVLKDCPFILDDPEMLIRNWVEIKRRGIMAKESMHLYIYSAAKSQGKSTFCNMFNDVVNPPNGRGCMDFSTPWQDHLSPHMNVLICDGLSGPQLNFKLVEDLSTIKAFFPKRNGGGIQWGPGPVLCTSNKSYYNLGYMDSAREPRDMEVWDVRFVVAKLDRPLHDFNKWFAAVHGLDLAKYNPENESTPVRHNREIKKRRPNHAEIPFGSG